MLFNRKVTNLLLGNPRLLQLMLLLAKFHIFLKLLGTNFLALLNGMAYEHTMCAERWLSFILDLNRESITISFHKN